MDYAATAQQTLEALSAAGGDSPGVTLTRTTPGAYDPATSTTGAGTTATHAGVGLAFDYDYIGSGAGTLGDSLIRDGDKQLYLAALKVDGSTMPKPLKGDRLLAPDGLTYNVERVKELAPAGVPLLYDVQLRL